MVSWDAPTAIQRQNVLTELVSKGVSPADTQNLYTTVFVTAVLLGRDTTTRLLSEKKALHWWLARSFKG